MARKLPAAPALLILAAAGCRPAMENGGPDAAYLSEPPRSLRARSERVSLFPAVAGSRWISVGKTGKGQTLTLETRVQDTARRVPGGLTGVLLDIRRNGRPLQQELYRVDSRGISGLATGPEARVTITPPMPLLRYPLQDGAICAWRGVLKQGKNQTPATAFCRVAGPERATTPAGIFPAWRLDIAVTLHTPRGMVPRAAMLWLAPNVGIVQQDQIIDGERVRLRLTRYEHP